MAWEQTKSLEATPDIGSPLGAAVIKNCRMRCSLVHYYFTFTSIIILIILINIIYLDLNRLWIRNLSRDDRVISENGKEVRYPFLDSDLIKQV